MSQFSVVREDEADGDERHNLHVYTISSKRKFDHLVKDHSHNTSTPKPMVTLPPSPSRQQPSIKFLTHPHSLTSTTVNILVFFNPPSPSTAFSKSLTVLFKTLSPLLPSTTLNMFTFVDSPSPPSVNNRQQIQNSKPSYPPPLTC